MSSSNIIELQKVHLRLGVTNPFIIAAHHVDFYPKGNANMEPVEYLPGRIKGNDFSQELPWHMYHGDNIPGFPAHPHRGFETISIVEQGFVDHTDSHGTTGRYGEGDVQWMTAGSGLQHCEMFPLVYQDKENTFELFQIWLNLPSKNKMVNPHYKMLWKEQIPVITETDANGNKIKVKVIAGDYKTTQALAPNPDSWAADLNNHVKIWLIELAPHANFILDATTKTANRMLYCYQGEVTVEDQTVAKKMLAHLRSDAVITLTNSTEPSYLLLLEGEPINEPIAAHGPFVMNTEQELQQAFADYHRTQFGGWPWPNSDPVNPADAGRFARYADGSIDKPAEELQHDEI